MRKCVLFTLVVAFGSMSSAAPVPKHLLKTPENPDLTAMQGKWKLTDVAFGGQSLGADFATKLELSLEFRENAMVTTGLQHKQRITAMIALDLSATPRRMTSSDGKETDLDGKPVENLNVGKKSVAIYKIDGDTLAIAGLMGDEANAPKDFAGKNVVSMTYTRVTK